MSEQSTYIDSVDSVLRSYLSENYMFRESIDSLDADTSLIGSGAIDSFGILSLVTFLEDRYEITITDDDVVPENLDTLSRLEQFVERKVSEKEGAK
jgi:acyl carrier protein